MKFIIAACIFFSLLVGCTTEEEKLNNEKGIEAIDIENIPKPFYLNHLGERVELPLQTIQRGADAFLLLKEADKIDGRAVGYSGFISNQHCAMYTIINSDDPIYWLEKLISEGSPAGKIYGLAAYCHLNSSGCEAMAHLIPEEVELINHREGCLSIDYSIPKLKQLILDNNLIYFSTPPKGCKIREYTLTKP